MDRAAMSALIVTAAAVLGVTACARDRDKPAVNDAGPTPASPRGSQATTSAASAEPAHEAAPEREPTREATPDAPPRARAAAEARRARVTRLEQDPALAKSADALRTQFGGAIPAVLVVQSVDLPGRRRALLVADGGKDGTAQERPMVLVVDEAGAAVWTKDRPAAGITPPVGQLALAGAPRGRLMMAACDPPTSAVALREWDVDGSPFADFHALDVESCEAVSLLYWPRHGWIVVAARADGSRAQLLQESGALAWGRGIPVGARWRTVAPASLAADTDDSFVLAQYAAAAGAPDHAMAFRYDARGAPLWAAAVDLGEVPRVPPGQERVLLARPTEGVVRATLAGGRTVEIAPSGELLRPRR